MERDFFQCRGVAALHAYVAAAACGPGFQGAQCALTPPLSAH